MEFVFVIPRTALFPEFYPQGFVRFGDPGRTPGRTVVDGSSKTLGPDEFASILAREGHFIERTYAERQPALKQVIPYSVVVSSARRGGRILLTQRSRKGGEARLHDRFSIGIGGHINPEDRLSSAGMADPLTTGTQREIAEETGLRGDYAIERVGILNDDSNPVGAVHVGVVQVVQVDATIEIREREQLTGRLVSLGELRAMLAEGANFESWSKLLIPHLGELLPNHLVAST
jgi:predicted NUDIX family phosphoesterase